MQMLPNIMHCQMKRRRRCRAAMCRWSTIWRFLARQAAHLAGLVRNLVSPYERMIIADAFANVDDFEAADAWYLRALGDAEDPIDRCVVARNYARFLFADGDLDRGRHWFSSAVSQLTGDSDRHLTYRADTYERWATLESEWSNGDRATQCLESARAEFARLQNIGRRTRELARLEKLPIKRTDSEISPAVENAASEVGSIVRSETGA
jgi:tetratricopeptide (TPR) repeat protein